MSDLGEFMGYRFNPPPNWPPQPPRWSPPPEWLPDPAWPPVPPGWNLWVLEDDSESTAPIRLLLPDPPADPPAERPVGRRRHSRAQSRLDMAAQLLPQRVRERFHALPMAARILLTLLGIVLLPWLLIAAGVASVGVGIVGLLRGSLPRFRLAGRPAAAAALLLGLVGVGGGGALAATVLTVAASRTGNPPAAAPARPSSIPTPGPTTPVLPSTVLPPATGPTTVASTTPTTSPTPSPSASPATTSPAPLCGAPANPFGYNFCGRGGYVLDPASDVCVYFDCTPNFRSGKGHLEECHDGMYSMSGGRPGSCVRHGGDLRAVYGGP
jgi:cell division septation protein DedD